jgi:hypothetical protein
MFKVKFVKEIKTRILCSVTFSFFRKSCSLKDNMEKQFCRTEQATDNMGHANFKLDNKG